MLASPCSHGLLTTNVYGILMNQACALPTIDEIFIICSHLSDEVKAQPLFHADMDCLTAIYNWLLLLQMAWKKKASSHAGLLNCKALFCYSWVGKNTSVFTDQKGLAIWMNQKDIASLTNQICSVLLTNPRPLSCRHDGSNSPGGTVLKFFYEI